MLALVGAGFTSSEIGQALRIAEDTVESSVASALRALGARNPAHAVAIALHRGLLVESYELVG